MTGINEVNPLAITWTFRNYLKVTWISRPWKRSKNTTENFDYKNDSFLKITDTPGSHYLISNLAYLAENEVHILFLENEKNMIVCKIRKKSCISACQKFFKNKEKEEYISKLFLYFDTIWKLQFSATDNIIHNQYCEFIDVSYYKDQLKKDSNLTQDW